MKYFDAILSQVNILNCITEFVHAKHYYYYYHHPVNLACLSVEQENVSLRMKTPDHHLIFGKVIKIFIENLPNS